MKKITLWLSFVLMMFYTTINAQQDFETATVGGLPTGWTSSQSATDDPGFTVQNTNGYAHGGSQYLAHLGVDISAESTSWVVSSAQTISSAYELRFFWRGKWSSFYNYTGVYVSTTSSDPVANPGDFTLLEELSPANYPNTWLQWNEAAYDLSAYSGQVYIAFKYVGDHAHDFYIDDFSVGPMPYCDVPGNIDVDNRYTDSLDISWDGVAGYDTYEVVWGAPGFDPNAAGVTPTQVTGTTYTITGLAQSTQYEIYVRTACSSYNYSSWIGPKVGFTSGPPPANDDCDNAIALTVNPDLNCGVVTSGTTLDATASPQPDDVTGYPNNDVWYSFVATSNRHFITLSNIVAVMGTSRDMGMGLYDGTGGCSGLTLVDDSDPNTFDATGLTAGTTYILRVYGWSSSLDYAQTFDVCVGTPPPPPANDACSGAVALTVYPEGGSVGNETNGDTTLASDSGVHPTCDTYGTNIDLYYTFTVPAGSTGVKVITGGNKGSAIEAALYDACGGAELDCQGRGTTKIFSGLTGGTTYTLQVWHDQGSSQGDFTIAVEQAPMPPANDLCADATTLTVYPVGGSAGNEVAASTLMATDSGVAHTCDTYGTNLDLFYSFTVPAGETGVAVYTGGAKGSRVKVAVHDACGGAELLCMSSGSTHLLSGLTGGTTYILQVWLDDYNSGDFTIAIESLPPPPANDLCANATSLTVYNSFQAVIGNNTNSTDSGETSPGCAYYQGGDIWYSVTVPTSGTVTVETASVAGSSVSDTGMAVYSGSCGSLVLVSCNDDGGAGYFSKVDVTGATPGETLYVRVWEYGNNSFGDIGVGAYDSSVSIQDNIIDSFNYYPNPVTNTLNISAKDNIQSISIFDITGKQVISVAPNALETRIDFSSLKSGIYFVKARVSGQMTAFKIIKK